MGFMDSVLGVKQVKIETKTAATIEDLFEKIKEVKFEAGQPYLADYGPNHIIAFPELDRNNQVQIMKTYDYKFVVLRSVSPVGRVLDNIVMDQLTDGWSSMSAGVGNKKKKCIELVTEVADKVLALDL